MTQANQHTYTPPCTKAEMIRLYVSDGLSQRAVGNKIGASQKVVFRAIHKWGIQKTKPCRRLGEQNPSWKGRNISYNGAHARVKRVFGNPQHCEVCGTTDTKRTYDWANTSGKHEGVGDYKRMCRSCHWRHDKIFRNFNGATKSADHKKRQSFRKSA